MKDRRDFVSSLGASALQTIRANIPKYFSFSGDKPVQGIVTNRTGNLLNSLLGNSPDSISDIEVENDSLVITIGTKVPYAALLEKGGVRIVTEKMRRFFWFKYLSSGISDDMNMWSKLRFKKFIVYRPRPFLKPAIESAIPEIKNMFTQIIVNEIRTSIEEAIRGTPRAIPLGATKL